MAFPYFLHELNMKQNVPQVIPTPDLLTSPQVRNHPDARQWLTRLRTTREAAELLAVSTTTVYRLVQRRELPVRRVGRGLRFSIADMERLLALRSSGPSDT